MRKLRGLLLVLRLLGVASMALLLYVWLHPANLGRWLGTREQKADGPHHLAVAGRSAAPAPRPPPPPSPSASAPPSPSPSPDYLAQVRVSPIQAAQARWIGAKYRVSPKAVGVLVSEADNLSKAYQLSPDLLIAVMAIESNFHPYIESEAGAQGLMQVMPRIHAKRYDKLGGRAIDPIINLKVGAEILRDCVKLHDGSEDEGLRYYFGGGAASDAYIEKVRNEQRRLGQVAAGIAVPVK